MVRADARFHGAVRNRSRKLDVEGLDDRRPEYEACILDPTTLPIPMDVRGSKVNDERVIHDRR